LKISKFLKIEIQNSKILIFVFFVENLDFLKFQFFNFSKIQIFDFSKF